jgi:hypothetical protein
LHYNFFRDYEPGTGRYIESDPLGIRSGFNTYVYALDNPAKFVDVTGLEVRFICRRLGDNKGPIGPQHCFVYITCPSEGWSRVLSLFSNETSGISFYPTMGYKYSYDPGVGPLDIDPNFGRDDPFSEHNVFNDGVPTPACYLTDCGFENDILENYYQFPWGNVSYRIFGPNSNTFAKDLIGGIAPPGAPGGNPLNGAPGINYRPFSGPIFGAPSS